ncbi:hypothetical protein F-VV57_0388 [Faustovirus]|nr:hypothetical protein F-VV57_0388 [Faustovirus]QJX73656.1 hypothetical protein F-VV63_0390 [Faustovirus]
MDACIVPIEIIELIAQTCDLPTLHALIVACKRVYAAIKQALCNAPIIEWTKREFSGGMRVDNGNILYAETLLQSFNASNRKTDYSVGFDYGWPTTYRICIKYGPVIYRFWCKVCESMTHRVWMYDIDKPSAQIVAVASCMKCTSGSSLVYSYARNRLRNRYNKLTGATTNSLSFNDTIEYIDKIGITLCNCETYAKILSVLMNKKIIYTMPPF